MKLVLNKQKTLLFAAFLSAVTVYGADFSAKTTRSLIVPTTKPPAIDGVISNNEYFGGMENFGLLEYNTAFLASRQGSFFATLDEQYLYLACRSEMPDIAGVKLKNRYKKRDSAIYNDDAVEFLLMPPGGKALYHLIVNPAGKTYDVAYPVVNGGVSPAVAKPWEPKLQVASKCDGKYWTVEMRIPLEDLGVTSRKQPSTWLMQFARSWTQPRQQCSMNQADIFANTDTMNPIAVESSRASVRFMSMGDYRNGENEIVFMIDNLASTARKIAYRIAVTSEAAPRQNDGEVIVPPNSSMPVVLKYTEKSKLSNEMNIRFTDLADQKIIYQRTLSWQNPAKHSWIAADSKSGAELEIGIYPYYKMVRGRLGNKGEVLDMRNVADVKFRISGKDGKVISKEISGKRIDNTGFYIEMPLPALPRGDYFVEAVVIGKDGKQSVRKTAFKFDKFEWEHNNIGLDRIVIAPYKSLIYGNNTVKTLMSQYTLTDGFFSKVQTGKAAELLAAPITVSINGKSPILRDFKWLEKAGDEGRSVSNLALENLNITVTNTIEFDNFVKTTMVIEPQKEFQFNTMTLSIPFKNEFARQLHSTCNAMKYNPTLSFHGKSGLLWSSDKGKRHGSVSNNFRPYIWVGNMAEGMAFFAESDRNWSRNPQKPMAELIRQGDTTTLKINFIDQAVKRNKPFELVFGFQATPTRTRPAATMQMTERYKAPNTVAMSTLAGAACWGCDAYDFFPKNYDYSFINAICAAKNMRGDEKKQNKISEDFLKKHFSDYSKDQQAFVLRHLLRGFSYANISTHLIPYLNARATQLRWPEYQVFMDEWFCADFRANNEDDYNNTPTRSFQDFMLHCTRRLVREGFDGIYYDNIRDWHNPNPVTGPAYETSPGKTQPYFDIFDMRKLIKRTAIMLQQEGKTIFDGRPLFVLHMTNTNIVPFTSLGSVTLDLEAMYGSMDFQDRFTEDYLKICTLGLQSGSIPEILVQITGNNKEHVSRSFLAVTLAYNLPFVMNGGGLTPTWAKTWRALKVFGYGTDDVDTFPCFAPSGAITCNSPDIRLTEYRRKDGKSVIAISSFGHAGKVKVKLPARTTKVSDFESKNTIELKKDKSIELELGKNDFKMMQIQ